MESLKVIEIITGKISMTGSPAHIPLLRGSWAFTAELTDSGVDVDSLENQPFLPWIVFQEAIYVLAYSGGRTMRGNAMDCRLGEAGLPLDSVEGHIAQIVYGKQEGDSVFHRITPVACILIWAGVCEALPGELMQVSE